MCARVFYYVYDMGTDMPFELWQKLLFQMFRLAVWDNDGRQYLPLFGYDGQIEAYAPAEEAINTFNELAESDGVEI